MKLSGEASLMLLRHWNGRFVFVILSIIARILWTNHGGVWYCSLFWACSLGFAICDFNSAAKLWQKSWRFISQIGAASNALVTIANGGYMPCISNTSAKDIWIDAKPDHLFLFLCDRFGGFSVGDFLIFSGLLAGIFLYALSKTRAKKPHQLLEVETGISVTTFQVRYFPGTPPAK